MMRRVLLVSLNFPPSTIASVHRARHMAKYLPEFGWQPLVIAVDERFHKEPPDPGLGGLVPPNVAVVRIGALPYSVSRWFGIGDLALRAMLPLKRTLDRLCAEFEPEVIFITGWPFYQMLLAPVLTRRHNIPVILDFQDPWASKEGATRKRWTKGWVAHKLAMTLEPWALAGANWVTSVSERQNADLAERYPWLDPRRMSAIPIGGDPEDYDALRGSVTAGPDRDDDQLTFSYVGTALPRAAPLLAILFEGLAELRATQPALALRIALRFIGTSNQAGASADYRVLPFAKAAGVADLVSEAPARVPFLDALRLLSETHGVLMIGSDEPHYTASKIYPGLMSGRPFLSIFHQASSAHAILSAAGGGLALAYAGEAGRRALVTQVAAALARLVLEPASLGKIDPAAYAAYTARAVAGQYAQVFNQVAAR